MRLDLMLCGRRVCVHCPDPDIGDTLARYYAPALVERQSAPEILIEITKRGTLHIDQGGVRSERRGRPVAPLLELAFLDLIFDANPDCPVLHAAFVVLGRQPIVLIAPSGSGKSTMTRAAVKAGATYVSDDLISLRGGYVHGFARSIRFSEILASAKPIPEYLEDTWLDGYGLRDRAAKQLTPIWWAGGQVLHAYEVPQTGVVVVQVTRGGDSVTPMTEVERLVALHEAAIIRGGEYDGSLGPGLGFRLAWNDPDVAFRLLVERLQSLLGEENSATSGK